MSTQERGGGRAGRRWRTAFVAVRDVAMTGLALYGVWHQEHTEHVKPWLLLTYVVILGLVPAQHALALAFSGARGPSSTPQESTDATVSPRL